MRRLSMTLTAIVLFLGLAVETQYGGPPIYPRDPDVYRGERERRMPEPRRYGPQMEPCIYRGDCRGPRPQPPRMPRYPEWY
jgi:hypothetical protein